MKQIGREIRIGPAGWSYANWNGVVYPARKPRGFHEAEYLAQFFDTIEINNSFYQPLRPETSKLWASRAEHNKNFKFTAKLLRAFTHDRNASRKYEKDFKLRLAPLAEAAALGACLPQFPCAFTNATKDTDYFT